ncbi:MAG: amino acid permease [Planctomycetia bacterium]|nr:amino acid permease [Planctomycetia bacterium]
MAVVANPTGNTLPRVLGPVAGFSVVVGSVIGSGIFMVPADVAHHIPYVGPIVLVWVIGGLFSAAGALTLAELGAMLPRAGGTYVYLREAYGKVPAFLFGWTEFLVMRAGSMATLAAAFARYFSQVVPAPEGLRIEAWQALAAVSAIALVTTVNVLGTKLGARLQVAGTAVKVGGVAALIALPFLIGGGSVSRLSPVWPGGFGASLLSGMMAAMVGVLWAYDGWINLTPMAEEVRDPGRNIPRAMISGMVTLIALYLAMTLMYHAVLPMAEVASLSGAKSADKAVAATYCGRLLGPYGVYAISALVMCSTFISLNGNALTGPRAYFAMARDGLFPAGLCRVHPRYQTPANAVLSQGVWASVLTVAGTVLILWHAPADDPGLPGFVLAAWRKLNETPLYRVLYNYVVFGANVFYLLAVASVFVLRARRPDAPRPYRTWGYPFTPVLFVLGSVYLLVDMVRQTPAESVAGLGIIAAGLVAYQFFARSGGRVGERKNSSADDTDGRG